MFGNLVQGYIRAEWHRARVDLQNLKPRLRIRHANFNLAIEAPRAAKRRIEDFRNVGGANDDDLAARNEAVHQAQQLRDDAFFDLSCDFGTLWGDRIDFINEQNGRRTTRRFLEDLAQLGFAFPVELS